VLTLTDIDHHRVPNEVHLEVIKLLSPIEFDNFRQTCRRIWYMSLDLPLLEEKLKEGHWIRSLENLWDEKA